MRGSDFIGMTPGAIGGGLEVLPRHATKNRRDFGKFGLAIFAVWNLHLLKAILERRGTLEDAG